MSPAPPRFFFDYVDPRSWIVDLRLRDVEGELGVAVVRHPLELIPPPAPLLDPEESPFSERWEEARSAGEVEGLDLRRPSRVPWSRKAHELAFHAQEKGVLVEVHDAIFRAFHLEGRDIGRVDVLVDIATKAGLDLTGTKAVLDVDRHLDTLRALRQHAERRGVPGVPTILAGDRLLEGLPDRLAIRDLLAGSSRSST